MLELRSRGVDNDFDLTPLETEGDDPAEGEDNLETVLPLERVECGEDGALFEDTETLMAGLAEDSGLLKPDFVELRLPGDTGIGFLLSGRLALDTVLAERELLFSSGSDRLTGSVTEAVVLIRFGRALVGFSVTPPVLFLLITTGVLELETLNEEDAVGFTRFELITAFFLVAVAARLETKDAAETLSGLLLPSAVVAALPSLVASTVVSRASSSALDATPSILKSITLKDQKRTQIIIINHSC